MSTKTIGNGVRTGLMMVLALGGWLASGADASPITQPLYYTTTGTVGDVAGPISFQGQSAGSGIVPGAINVGSFEEHLSLPGTATLSYANTPFTVSMHIFNNGFGDSSSVSNLEFDGTLNGAITGNTQSNMAVTITSVHQTGGATLPFPLSALEVPSPLYIAPSAINGGETPLLAQISQVFRAPIPEPTSLGLYAVALAGLGAWRRRRHAGARLAAA